MVLFSSLIFLRVLGGRHCSFGICCPDYCNFAGCGLLRAYSNCFYMGVNSTLPVAFARKAPAWGMGMWSKGPSQETCISSLWWGAAAAHYVSTVCLVLISCFSHCFVILLTETKLRTFRPSKRSQSVSLIRSESYMTPCYLVSVRLGVTDLSSPNRFFFIAAGYILL